MSDHLMTPTDIDYSGRASNTALGFRQYNASKHAQFFTPKETAEALFETFRCGIPEDRLKEMSVLDPTCGNGRLLHPWKRAGAHVMGIELDKEAGERAQRVLGKKHVRIGDILGYRELLHNFSLVLTNPPYGIHWQFEEHEESECAAFGGGIESQAAVIEIATKALSSWGMLVALLPASTFEVARHKRLRDHLFTQYDVLLIGNRKGLFREEYGIDVEVSIVVARRTYSKTETQPPVMLDLNGPLWKQDLCTAWERIVEERNVYVPYGEADPVPQLSNLVPCAISRTVELTAKGCKASPTGRAMMDFLNETVSDYNPVLGIPTGVIDAHCSLPCLIARGADNAGEQLQALGFDVSAPEKHLRRLASLRKKFDFLCIPIHLPKAHQLPAYYHDREYVAKETVGDAGGAPLFRKGRSYHLHPAWTRNAETVKVETAFDEKEKCDVTTTTRVDRGFLSITVGTEGGERAFPEMDLDAMKLFTRAFEIPDVKDLGDCFPERVGHIRTHVARKYPFLFGYQADDVARLALKPFAYLGYDMGGGKTITSAVWAVVRGYKRVLVVCESKLVKKWVAELGKFGFAAQSMMTHQSVSGLQEEQRRKQGPEGTTFYVTSYEFLALDPGRIYAPWECIKYDQDGTIIHQVEGNRSRTCAQCSVKYQTAVRQCPKCESREAWTGNCCRSCGYVAYTYTGAKRAFPAYRRVKKLFSCVIVDEAQIAKSKNTLRGRAVRALRTKGRMILTGTLMKGYVHDVYFNVSFLLGFNNPLFPYDYRGGTKRFLEEFGTYEYVTREFQDTLHEGRARMLPEVSNLNRFWRLIGSFTVRRMKSEISALLAAEGRMELPEKHREVLTLPMAPDHAALYERYQSWAENQISEALRSAENHGEVNMGKISRALWKLRFCATVPNARSHLTGDGDGGGCLDSDSWNKIDAILRFCKEIRAAGEKVVIFSGLRPFQAQMVRSLRTEGIAHLAIFADTPAPKRFELIQEFSANGATALVTGLEVLNRGFDIVAANHAIITDVQYSPEATLQAEDRIHRPGQTRHCHVSYLLSEGTIDEIMFDLITKKAEAIGHAINGEVRFEQVARLLEEVRGDVRLEIARRLTAGKEPRETGASRTVPAIPELPAPQPCLPPVEAPSTMQEVAVSVLRRRKRKPISPDQLSLFGLFG